MPRTVHGFDVMNRTHRISSPTEPAVLASGMPNACNLCHLDRSLGWTRDALAEGWGKRVDLPPYLEEFFGARHSAPAGDAWLSQPVGMLRAVAGAAYARSPSGKQKLPRMLGFLDDPNAYLRTRWLQIVEQTLDRKLDPKEYTLTGPPELRKAAGGAPGEEVRRSAVEALFAGKVVDAPRGRKRAGDSASGDSLPATDWVER
jgi:hypothetical protein